MTLGSGLMSSQSPKQERFVYPSKGGVAGEVGDLRQDVENELAALAALAVEEWTNPATADVDAIVATPVATSASAQTIQGAQLDGVIGTGVMDPPRPVTITSDSHGDHDAVAVVVTGTDINDQPLTDTITKTDGGGTTDEGDACFKTVTKLDVPAESGTGGTMTVGFGTAIGLAKPIKTRAGAVAGLISIEAGTRAAPAAGTSTGGATAAPNGSYDPNSAPNGTNDYALYYEYDPAG